MADGGSAMAIKLKALLTSPMRKGALSVCLACKFDDHIVYASISIHTGLMQVSSNEVILADTCQLSSFFFLTFQRRDGIDHRRDQCGFDPYKKRERWKEKI
jgi:hypothetical protein